jgi:hypothetical protein
VYDRKAKEILSQKVSALTNEELQHVVDIVLEEISQEEKESSEVCIDLELLSNQTLAKLWAFADSCLAKRNAPPTPDQMPERKHVGSAESDED